MREVSVLVPAFNAEKYIEATLENLVAEVVGCGDVIVCDDGSTDKTTAIVEKYQRDFPGIVSLVRQNNRGPGSARNAAFKNSLGKWIVFFDADDLYKVGSLIEMLTVAREHPGAVVHCNWATVSSDGFDDFLGPTLFGQVVSGTEWLLGALDLNYPTYPGSFLVSRELVLLAGLWDERLRFQDDIEFFARLLTQNCNVVLAERALFRYRSNVLGSVSKTGGYASAQSHLLATKLATGHLQKKADSDVVRSVCAKHFMLVAFAQYLHGRKIAEEACQLAIALDPKAPRQVVLPGGPLRRVLQWILGWRNAIVLHKVLTEIRRWVRTVGRSGGQGNL